MQGGDGGGGSTSLQALKREKMELDKRERGWEQTGPVCSWEGSPEEVASEQSPE